MNISASPPAVLPIHYARAIHDVIKIDINPLSSFESCDLIETDSEIVVTALSREKRILEKRYNLYGNMLIKMFKSFVKYGDDMAGFQSVITEKGDRYQATWTFVK